jgi:hypothetical protein
MVDVEKTVRQVLSGANFREEWGFLQRLADRSPLEYGLPDPKALDDVEYRCNGVLAKALGWAHLLDTAAVSFPSNDIWRQPSVTLSRSELVSSGDVVESEVRARNIGHREQAEAWKEWLVAYGGDVVPTAMGLWDERHERFPNLRFLNRVRGDLTSLGDDGAAYGQALGALDTLNNDLGNWGGVGVIQYSRKVTPEAEQRKRLCDVVDVDGQEYCFDLHARFTGSIPGRIHFRVSGPERKAVVAYVGIKLERAIE